MSKTEVKKHFSEDAPSVEDINFMIGNYNGIVKQNKEFQTKIKIQAKMIQLMSIDLHIRLVHGNEIQTIHTYYKDKAIAKLIEEGKL